MRDEEEAEFHSTYQDIIPGIIDTTWTWGSLIEALEEDKTNSDWVVKLIKGYWTTVVLPRTKLRSVFVWAYRDDDNILVVLSQIFEVASQILFKKKKKEESQSRQGEEEEDMVEWRWAFNNMSVLQELLSKKGIHDHTCLKLGDRLCRIGTYVSMYIDPTSTLKKVEQSFASSNSSTTPAPERFNGGPPPPRSRFKEWWERRGRAGRREAETVEEATEEGHIMSEKDQRTLQLIRSEIMTHTSGALVGREEEEDDNLYAVWRKQVDRASEGTNSSTVPMVELTMRGAKFVADFGGEGLIWCLAKIRRHCGALAHAFHLWQEREGKVRMNGNGRHESDFEPANKQEDVHVHCDSDSNIAAGTVLLDHGDQEDFEHEGNTFRNLKRTSNGNETTARFCLRSKLYDQMRNDPCQEKRDLSMDYPWPSSIDRNVREPSRMTWSNERLEQYDREREKLFLPLRRPLELGLCLEDVRFHSFDSYPSIQAFCNFEQLLTLARDSLVHFDVYVDGDDEEDNSDLGFGTNGNVGEHAYDEQIVRTHNLFVVVK